MRLQFKVIRIVLVGLLVIGLISGAAMFYSQRQATVLQLKQMAIMLAGTLQGALEHSMTTGDREMTQKVILDVSEQKTVSGVVLVSPNGIIAASSKASEVGKGADNDDILKVLQSGEVSTKLTRQDGKSELWIIAPVLNQPECTGCHSRDDRILGVIKVGLDATRLDNQVMQQTIFLGVLGLLTFVIIGSSLAIAVRRTVLAPLFRLAGVAERFSQGDYTVRARSDNTDEIGILARTFNEMAESVENHTQELEASRRELASWNIDLESKIEQRTHQIATLNSIITTVSQSLDLGWILDVTLSKILALMDLEAGAVHLLDEKSDRLNIMAYHGLVPECVQKIKRLRMGEEIMGQAIQSGEPVIVNDAKENLKITTLVGEKGEFRAYAGIPIKSKRKTLGTLSLASHLANKFDPEKVILLQSMGEAIGIAVENALAAQRLEEMGKIREQLLKKLISAQEEERRRIARELHDNASQSLVAVVLQLDDVADILPAGSSNIREKLDMLRERLVQTIQGVRDLALELRPSALDDLGLSKAIEWYAKDYLVKNSIDFQMKTSGSGTKLPQYTETMLFRVVQEALANVVRHADASQVKVQLQLNDTDVKVTIEDNGKGFDVDAVLSREAGRTNLGIHGMSERVALLGGTFNIQAQPGKGSHISIEIPCK